MMCGRLDLQVDYYGWLKILWEDKYPTSGKENILDKQHYGELIHQKPDLVVEVNNKHEFILDTKWGMVIFRASEAEIRQMFAFKKLFNVNQAFLAIGVECEIFKNTKSFLIAKKQGRILWFDNPKSS